MSECLWVKCPNCNDAYRFICEEQTKKVHCFSCGTVFIVDIIINVEVREDDRIERPRNKEKM